MGRLSGVFTRLMLRERCIGRFETKVAAGKEEIIPVSLQKGMEYAVRGRISSGRGTLVMSVEDAAGSTLSAYRTGKGKSLSLSVNPEASGVYHIRAAVKAAGVSLKPDVIDVTLSRALPVPGYIVSEIGGRALKFIGPVSREAGMTKEAPETEPAMEGIRARTGAM